ncbi:SMI1/KNR4 family protein [Neisseria sp. P0008.S010]|uniref:SMI1/KNR4 family protein n=1 Tax=Neisseria sp. P0008.S010 TaxID=3436707 RepID=UPI003F822B0C
MENILLRQLENVLCEGMKVPEELRRLYQWIEDNGFYEDREGIRYGYLYPQQALRDSWTDTEREGGTIISFYSDSREEQDETVTHYYGNKDEEISSRLCIFGQTGADGSMGALWLDDEGETRIVHLGSGSGSTMLCTLAQNGLDFLRLLAIGYDEICWDSELPLPPNHDKDELFVKPNLPFRAWVENTFRITIPELGTEIVTPVQMGEQESKGDSFVEWSNKVVR